MQMQGGVASNNSMEAVLIAFSLAGFSPSFKNRLVLLVSISMVESTTQ